MVVTCKHWYRKLTQQFKQVKSVRYKIENCDEKFA